MKTKNGPEYTCAVCGKKFPGNIIVPATGVRDVLVEEIRNDGHDLPPDGYICRNDLNAYRTRYVSSLLKTEKGELSSMEQGVIRSLRDHEILSRDIESQFETQWTFGERLADKIADFGGSWSFLIAFACFLAVWIVINTVMIAHPFDPFPYILLNLILSCLASIQAPIIMMSQNRQEAKDRVRSQHDYQVNLKAELEIRQLHDKIDHLLMHQWERLAQIQEIQLDLMSELGRKK